MNEARTTTQANSLPERSGHRAGGLALIWFAGFCVAFFSLKLPNSEYTRHEILLQLPWLLLDVVDPPPVPDAPPSGWQFVPQRLHMAGVSLLILAGAWGFGRLVLRCLGPQRDLSFALRTTFAFGLGLAVVSLMTLGAGLLGTLSRGLLGGILALAFTAELTWIIVSKTRCPGPEADQRPPGSVPDRLGVTCVAIVIPFLLLMTTGALSPPVDFDVREYHLQGPKEYFEAGRISFLPHNVYTSFPFLSEMLSLLAMVLCDDWFSGALAGKLVLMSFAPLTACGLFAAGQRWFGRAAAWMAVVIHLSTPWVYRISIIALAEGALTFYLLATLLALQLAIDRMRDGMHSQRMSVLTGLLAGSAMACKYPGVLSVVLPAGTVLVLARTCAADASNRWRVAIRCAAIYSVGVLIAIGPWLLKNTCETGNPVYPLLYSVFGGRDWDDNLNVRWAKGHSPDHHRVSDLVTKFGDVTLRSDWLSPLLFGLAPLALLNGPERRRIGWLWGYVAFLFLAWWVFTHRIDRFWVPLIPVVSLLAGIGAVRLPSKLWRRGSMAIIGTVITFNFVLCSLQNVSGYNAGLSDLNAARTRAAKPTMRYLALSLPPGSRVLCVGEAEVFDATFPLRYNTVFDHSIFKQWFARPEPGVSDAELRLRAAAEIRNRLTSEGITHIFVNWREILRYRQNYGYTDFVAPARFRSLMHDGVIAGFLQPMMCDARALDDGYLKEIEKWAPELRRRGGDRDRVVCGEFFRVVIREE